MDFQLFRRFYEDLLDTDQDRGHELLQLWTAPTAAMFAELGPLRTRFGKPSEQLWDLYALSRISHYLLSFYQPDVHTWFYDEVGLEKFTSAESFSPFHHEIVAVTNDPAATSVTVSDVRWPGFRFGDLMFCRAGVSVRAPADLIDADAAMASTLYFTHRREGRKYQDASLGWGSNSQWRTAFDRFYEDDDGFHFNWDGRIYIGQGFVQPPNDPNSEFPLEQRRELLVNRCLVRAPLPADEWDRMPYVDRMSTRRSTWPLDPADILPEPSRNRRG